VIDLSPKNKGLRALPLVLLFGTMLCATTAVHGAPKRSKRAKSQSVQRVTKSPVKSYERRWLTAEDLRLGQFHAPPQPYSFPVLSQDKAKEVYVDAAGRLYKDRKYSGVVPNWRTKRRLRRGRCRVRQQTLTWVGFQNAFSSSRIFIQVDQQACGYVYRPDPKHIVIDLPAVTIDNPNLKRDILTGAFPSAVAMVHVEALADKGTRVTIVLREARHYLSAHIGRYLFVDIAR